MNVWQCDACKTIKRGEPQPEGWWAGTLPDGIDYQTLAKRVIEKRRVICSSCRQTLQDALKFKHDSPERTSFTHITVNPNEVTRR